MLSISLLTPFALQQDHQPLTLTSRRTEALFVYLLRTGKAQARDVLANLFWDDLTQTQAAGNLRVLIANLHKAVGTHVTISRQSMAFDLKSYFRCDLTVLEQALTEAHSQQSGGLSQPAAQKLAQALDSYRGELLPGFYLRGGQQFDEWLATEREWLRTRVIEALSDLTNTFLRLGDFRAGIEQAQRLVKLDPLREEGHQQLMQLLAADGQTSAALAHYQRCLHVLDAEMSVPPSPATTQLFQQIQRGEWKPPTRPANVHHDAPSMAHNLPRPLLPFVGREAELARLAHLLNAPTTPLITLVGEGGMGKTALAIEAARRLLEAHTHPDGIFLVPLAAVSEVAAMPVAIATAIGFRFQKEGGDERTQLLAHLKHQSLLLLLDNVEHLLIEDGPNKNVNDLIQEILQAAPQVRLFITSRHNLNCPGESVLRLDGLDLPTENALSASAVQLFVQSVHRAHGVFDFSADDLAAIARICHWAQGMPLAIVLAASWVETHTFAEIAAQIEQNVGALAAAQRHLPERQRSMTAVFDCSWQLLSADEQRVFARMSIFRAGCTRPVAQLVTGGSSQHLLALEHKSHIQRDLSSGRFSIHELLRQLAGAKLADMGEAIAPLHVRAVEGIEKLYAPDLAPYASELAYHAEQAGLTEEACRYLRLAGDVARDHFQNSQAIDFYSRALALTAEDDVDACFVLRMARQTIYHLLGNREKQAWDLSALQSLAEGLSDARRPIEVLLAQARYLEAVSDYSTAVAIAQKAAQLAETSDMADLLCKSHLMWGQGLWRLGHLEAAQHQLECALTEVQSIADPLTESTILRSLGIVFEFKWRYAEAKTYYLRSLALCRQLGNRQGEVSNLNNLGVVAFCQHDLTGSHRYLEEALAIRRSLGDKRGEGHGLHNLGELMTTLGDFERSRGYAEASLIIFRQIGDRWGEADALHNLGGLLMVERAYERACAFYQQALEIAQQIGYQRCETLTYRSLGHLSLHQKHLDAARHDYEAALSMARQANFTGYALEASAGLAVVMLGQGNPMQAQHLALEALEAMNEQALSQAHHPFRIYYDCYRVLQVTQPAQATAVLQRAHAHLQQQAAQISDKQMRQSFLQNVTVHRDIIAALSRQTATAMIEARHASKLA